VVFLGGRRREADGRGMCEIPKERPYLLFGFIFDPCACVAGRKPETIQLRCKMAASMYVYVFAAYICVCVREVLSVMCNKVSFYRPASTSGQLLVTPKPQSQPQPQKHNSCPSDWPPDFPHPKPTFPTAVAAAENVARIFTEEERKLKALLWLVAIVRFLAKQKFLCRSFAIVVALQLSEEAH